MIDFMREDPSAADLFEQLLSGLVLLPVESQGAAWRLHSELGTAVSSCPLLVDQRRRILP